MKRINHNRIPISYWWGFIYNTKDLAFFIDSKTVAFILENGEWIIRSL